MTAQKKYEEFEKILLEAYKDAREVDSTHFRRTKDVASELVKFHEAWNKLDRELTSMEANRDHRCAHSHLR